MYKKNLFKALILTMLVSSQLSAQIQIDEVLKAGKEDATILFDAYFSPFGEMMGRAVNGGWYNVASLHSILGFDVNIGMNIAMVSSSGKTFLVDDAFLAKMSPGWSVVGTNNEAPTISGKMKDTPTIEKSGIGQLHLPDGLRLSVAPIPIFQVGLGLPARTDIIVRFFPTIKLGDFKAGLWGVGLKHDLKEYIPIVKHLPVLQTSILLGYTKMGMNFNVGYPIKDDTERAFASDISGFTGRLLVGANLPIVSLYMGLGYGHSTSGFDLEGEYEIDGKWEKDPISLKFTNNLFDANIGVRLKFGVVTLHGDYTIGDYSMITAGLGVSFR